MEWRPDWCGYSRPWNPARLISPGTTRRPDEPFLRPDDGKCLHYYFYFIDEELGLCYVRVPAWCPFRLQFYCNGHHRLAHRMDSEKIRYRMRDNAFTAIDDFSAAQRLADDRELSSLHKKLDALARRYCPILGQIEETYHWSLDQVEYATDIVFPRQADLNSIYEHLIRTAIHTVKPDDSATFLGRKLNGNSTDEMGNRYNVRIEGTRVRHSMGMAAIKMYDKFGHILRIETTAKKVSFFRHYREVEQRDGTVATKFAPVKKSIYSLAPLRRLLLEANRRCLEFLSAIDDPGDGVGKLARITRTINEQARSCRGFNFFDEKDENILPAIARGEFNISGMQNRMLRSLLPRYNSSQISRILKRLRIHGLLRKAPCGYTCYLTRIGKQAIAVGLAFKQLTAVPRLANA